MRAFDREPHCRASNCQKQTAITSMTKMLGSASIPFLGAETQICEGSALRGSCALNQRWCLLWGGGEDAAENGLSLLTGGAHSPMG